MNRVVALGLLFYTTTIFVFGQIQITEVMYDPAGSDTGREWIEVQNTSTNTINFTTWKFFEANVNHGIDQIDGYSQELNPEEYGVVVSDKVKFLTDFPNFSGKIFKSSFSLSNSGENLAFKTDSSGTIIDEYLYDVLLGAAGDGNSLQKGSTWAAALPTPGLLNNVGTPSQGTGGDGGAATTTSTSTTSTDGTITQPPVTTPIISGSGAKFVIPHVFGVISAPTIVLAGVEVELSAQAFTGDGKEMINTQFTWNFGDGAIGIGKKNTHRYKYPGTYSVALESLVSFGASNSIATEHRTITVAAPLFYVVEEKDTEGEVYVLIENKTEYKVDVSSWIIRRGENGSEYYVLPKNTFIAPYTAIRIPQEVTNFKNDGVLRLVELLFPNGKIAAQYEPVEPSSKISEKSVDYQGTPLVANTVHVPNTIQPVITKKIVSNQNITVPQQISTPHTDFPKEQSEKIIEDATSSSSTVDFMTAAVTTSKQNGTSVLWYALPLLALVIGASIFLSSKKEPSVFEEYTIIDDGK